MSDSTSNTSNAKAVQNVFTALEVRNITFYIIGIMCYKYVLELMNSSVSGIIQNRLVGFNGLTKDNTGKLWTLAQGIATFSQCLGSLLVAPLVRRMPAGKLLAFSILLFGATAAFFPIMEIATGGSIPNVGIVDGVSGSSKKTTWGE
jgi:hypothetical protein